ncbi:MAG TPA: DUF2461 domain-containing protein [Acidimicrobiia bacterium]
MGFTGWPAEALEFYEGLEADNTRAYWTDHKADYEAVVKAPMEALLSELAPKFGVGRIFRPYRDVRFSADKSPYKTSIAATLDGGGYVQLSAEGLAAGCGMYHLMPDQLQRYRDGVVDDRTGRAVARIVDRVRAQGMEVTAHDQLKTAPRGYPKDHARIELLRLKGLVTWKQWPVAAWLGTAKAKDRVVGFLRASQPLNKWLQANVGPSTLEPDRRS